MGLMDKVGNFLQGDFVKNGVKEMLIAQNAWSQYLEVGIGPDAEVFTKSQPFSLYNSNEK